MLHPLQERVGRVAAKARRRRWLFAGGWTLATLLAAVVVWGLVDYVLHVADAGVRAIATFAILVATGLVAWRFLVPLCGRRQSDLAVAQKIEQHFPSLGDRLSSSLAFLGQEEDDQTAGSAALRRAVIADTMARTDGLDFSQVLDGRPARRALLALGGVVLVVIGLIIADANAVRLVAVRTFWPWTSASWPRRHELAFENPPLRLAIGSDFEVQVMDNAGRLPDRVTLEYWFDGDRPDQVQRREMKLLGAKMVQRLENVTRAFKYRAWGGDDLTMPWHELAVLASPQVTSLVVKVQPPAYTGWPTEQAAPDFAALEGSRVEIVGEVDMPITAAKLLLEGAAQAFDVPIAIAADGLSLRLPASPDKPWLLGPASAYALELTSSEELTSKDARYDIRVLMDRPPAVVVEKPADNTQVTPQAVIPVRVLVKDDLNIARVELRYLRSDQSDAGEQTIELFAGPAEVARVAKSPLGQGVLAGESRLVEFSWKLAEIADLSPGVTLTWHVAASDYKPQVGVSPAQRLAIISRDELEDRITQRQASILAQLHEALRLERDARSQTSALDVQLANVNRLSKQDLDYLLGAELNQRQVERALASETDGVLTQVAVVLAELESNRLDSPEVVRRMNELATEVRRITQGPLPVIARELGTAQRLVRDDLDKLGDVPTDGKAPTFDAATREATQAALATTGKQQDETVAALERLLSDLAEWDNYRRFAREVSRLRSDQETVQKETHTLQPQTISKNVRDLGPTELAALKRLAQRQTELARQFDKIVSRMNAALGSLAENQPLASETIADALEAARRLGISSQMQEAAGSIERNQLGSVGEGQREIGESLRELLDVLSSRKEHELGRRLKQLREAEGELTALRQQVSALRVRTAAAGNLNDQAQRQQQLQRLQKEHERLANEAQRMARRLERLQAEKAGEQTGEAGGKLAAGGEQSQQDAAAQALEKDVQAEKQLEEAQQQLRQAIAQAQQELFFEQVAKLEQAIAGLVARQQSVVQEIVRLEGLKTINEGEWTASQRTSVRSLTEQERDLATETVVFAQKLAQAEAFRLALDGAMREMQRAAARLEQFQTDAPTQAAANIALARLQQLLEALKPEPPLADAHPPEPANPGANGQPPPMPPGDALNLLAELKLLKLMQEEINRRTTELEAVRLRTGMLPTAQEAELVDLAAEQGKLADLVLNLVERASQQAQSGQGDAPISPPPKEQSPPADKDPLDLELEKSLDNDLLPRRQ